MNHTHFLILNAIFIIIFILINHPFSNFNKNKCLINFNLYPELNEVISNTHIILNELNNVINIDKWIKYDDFHNKQIFHTNHTNLHEIFKNSESSLNINNISPSWKLFGLIYNRQIYNSHDKYCPFTINMLLNIPYVINATFSCLEPGKITDYHSDNNTNYYRVQIPIIIPNGDCKFKLENNILDWSYPFIFDDNCMHQVWNFTNNYRFVLILDILRNKN